MRAKWRSDIFYGFWTFSQQGSNTTLKLLQDYLDS